MSSGTSSSRAAVRLFDAHCHLQDPRVFGVAPKLIRTALDSGVLRFAVNGVSEKDWKLVKEMGDDYPSVIPCFGLHPWSWVMLFQRLDATPDCNWFEFFGRMHGLFTPLCIAFWYVSERSPNWLRSLREFFNGTPSAAVGEVGLDKGSRGKEIDFLEQVDVFRQQLELAKELERPVSIHCVRAYGDLLEIMQSAGPFPAGVILHSYLGSAEMVPGLAKLGAYFSFSGFLMSLKSQKAKKMLKSVPADRILLESDAPEALPKSNLGTLQWVEGDDSVPQELRNQGENTIPDANLPPDNEHHALTDASTFPNETLNHPVNIHCVLKYVASLLEMPEEEVAELSYRNTMQLFSYPGSKVCGEG